MSMWMWGWLERIADYFGFSRKRARVVFLGLDNAGKTTLMRRMRDDTVHVHAPTYHSTSEEFSIGGVRITVFDLGGHQQVRRIWKDYFPTVDAVVFIVDAADQGRLAEARSELEGLLFDEAISNCPLLVLGNKIDRDSALGEDSLRSFLGLDRLCSGKEASPREGVRPLELFMCSVVQGQGYGAAFRWLGGYLK